MEGDQRSGVSKSVRSGCAIYRDEALFESAAAAHARAAPPHPDQSGCVAQDQPKSSGAHGGRGSVGFSRPPRAWIIGFGSFAERLAEGCLKTIGRSRWTAWRLLVVIAENETSVRSGRLVRQPAPRRGR